MNRPEFFDHIIKLYASGVEIIRRKNAGYATGENPFANFLNAQIVGIDPKQGILVRTIDKISRIGRLLEDPNNNQVKESIHDTIIDAINYLAILDALIVAEEKELPPATPHPPDEGTDGFDTSIIQKQ